MYLACMHEKQVVANSVHALLILHVGELKKLVAALHLAWKKSTKTSVHVKKKNCSPGSTASSSRDPCPGWILAWKKQSSHNVLHEKGREHDALKLDGRARRGQPNQRVSRGSKRPGYARGVAHEEKEAATTHD
ncbi:hypothetical protein ACOSP7_018788 [Xanthoceras sorbifolium]